MQANRLPFAPAAIELFAAVLYQSAKQARLEAIVTRNVKDFTAAEMVIYTPEELINLLKNPLKR